MKTKMVASFMIMALCCALIGGATFAWFTSTADNTGNTIATGSLDVNASPSPVISIENMQPGDSFTDYLLLTNDGSVNALFKFAVTEDATSTLDPQYVKVKIVSRPTGAPALPGTYNEYGIDEHQHFEGTLAQLLATDFSTDPEFSNLSFVRGGFHFEPNDATYYGITISMDTAVTSAQAAGKAWSGNFKITGVQEAHQDLNNVDWD